MERVAMDSAEGCEFTEMFDVTEESGGEVLVVAGGAYNGGGADVVIYGDKEPAGKSQ